MDITNYDFEYLRPPKDATFLNHTMEYIKSGSGKTAKRKIFYNTPFDTTELKAINDLENLLQKQGVGLPPQWSKSETLKYLYSGKFDLNVSAKMIRNCLDWRMDPRSSILSTAVRHYYHSGVIYTFGLDYHFRPILIVNLNKFKEIEAEEESFDAALAIMMDVLRSYCFIPRKIENWVIIVDAQNVKTIEIVKIKPVIYLIKCIFPSSLEKLFVISSPGLFEHHWDCIQDAAGGDLPEEIHLLSNTDLFKLQTFIPPDSLEKKYGGVCPDVQEYWPPPDRQNKKKGSVANLSHYSEQNSDFLNESFRSEGKMLTQPTPEFIVGQPKVNNNQRHTVSGPVAPQNNLRFNGNVMAGNERLSHNNIPSMTSLRDENKRVSREEEFIRNFMFSKSPSKNEIKPESLRSFNGTGEVPVQSRPVGSVGSLQYDSPDRMGMMRPQANGQRNSFQVRHTETGIPRIQGEGIEDDMLSVRSMASNSSRASKRPDIQDYYGQTLAEQLNHQPMLRFEPDSPVRKEGSVGSFREKSSPSSSYGRPPVIQPVEVPKKTVYIPQPELNQMTRSPFGSESPKKSVQLPDNGTRVTNLSFERGGTVQIEGNWKDMEDRSTKKVVQWEEDKTKEEWRKSLIENLTVDSSDEDEGDRFCGLCISKRGKKYEKAKKQKALKATYH